VVLLRPVEAFSTWFMTLGSRPKRSATIRVSQTAIRPAAEV
jgi:hypothetical protein